MKVWNVFNNANKKIDKVFFADSLDAEYIKQSLIGRDNFEPTIVVKPCRAKKS